MIKKSVTIALVSLMIMTVAEAKSAYGTVNGVDISEADVQMTMGPSGMQYANLDAEMQTRVIEMVVDRTLLTQSAEKSDVASSPEYKAQLAALGKGLLLDVWMKKMMSDIDKGLTKEKLEAAFKKTADKYTSPKKLKARHILVKTEDEAKALLAELETAKDKKAKFIELAKSKSTGPSGKDGGDLGWFELAKMVPEFSKAADALKKGDYTKTAVKTQFGFHLIMLDDRKEAKNKTFAEVEAQLKGELGQAEFTSKIQALTKKLRKKAKVELVTPKAVVKPVAK